MSLLIKKRQVELISWNGVGSHFDWIERVLSRGKLCAYHSSDTNLGIDREIRASEMSSTMVAFDIDI